LFVPAWTAEQACSWAHILGLFRLDTGGSLLSMGHRGAMADVLLWALARAQTHLFASATFGAVVAVVCEEEARAHVALEASAAAWRARQAEAAVKESRQRAARRQRVDRLKVGGCGNLYCF
jgi:hypothetical protein